MSCPLCEALMINGVYCHEQGCPDAWKDYDRECKECGSSFRPETRHQDCCSEECTEAYHGTSA